MVGRGHCHMSADVLALKLWRHMEEWKAPDDHCRHFIIEKKMEKRLKSK